MRCNMKSYQWSLIVHSSFTGLRAHTGTDRKAISALCTNHSHKSQSTFQLSKCMEISHSEMCPVPISESLQGTGQYCP